MKSESPYSQLAPIYDALFLALGKDYLSESQKVNAYIQQYKKSSGNDLLDIGCGTGEHIKYLKNTYNVIGADISDEMLMLAKQKNPDVSFCIMNLLDFNFDQKFDAIICLFSAIGYLVTKENLDIAIRNVSAHLKKGGVFIVEPWYSPDEIERHLDIAEFGEKHGVKACRMRETQILGNIAESTGHILVSQNGHVEYHISHHIFGLFSKNDFIGAFARYGIKICSMDFDLNGRGLYIGVKEI